MALEKGKFKQGKVARGFEFCEVYWVNIFREFRESCKEKSLYSFYLNINHYYLLV